MTEYLWHRDEPQSPCVKICLMHPSEGLCMGCLRTLDEIAGWSQMPPEARAAVLAELPARAPRLRPYRRRRSAPRTDA